MKALFVKAVRTKENPKKNNVSWTIIHLLIPEAVKPSTSETEGALIQIMTQDDPASFKLVQACKFGDKLEIQPVIAWRGGRQMVDYQIVSIAV